MPDHVMNYVESSAPADVTLVEWRRARVVASSRRRLRLRTLFTPRLRPAFAV
jgi:hypothetical protein